MRRGEITITHERERERGSSHGQREYRRDSCRFKSQRAPNSQCNSNSNEGGSGEGLVCSNQLPACGAGGVFTSNLGTANIVRG
eukprot:210447-Chlamydomonas_euryale.AAC.4